MHVVTGWSESVLIDHDIKFTNNHKQCIWSNFSFDLSIQSTARCLKQPYHGNQSKAAYTFRVNTTKVSSFGFLGYQRLWNVYNNP